MKHRIWLVILPICFLVVFYFYPLLNILILGLLSDGKWGVEKFLQLISKSYYLKTFWFTTWQAFLSTLLALVTALPGAYIFAKYQFPGKRLLRTISTLPFVLPTIVVAAAFQALLGKNGFFNILFSKLFTFDEPVIQINHSICFILIAHVFYNYSVVFRIISGFWCNIKDEMNEAASLLGASPSQVFFKVALPLLKPALLASSILVFILCFSSFGVVLILGGPRYATIEVEIYRQAVNYFNLPVAAALSLIQIVFTFILMWVYTGIQRKTAISLTPKGTDTKTRKSIGTGTKLIIAANCGCVFIFMGTPLIALLLRSIVHQGKFSLIYYFALFENKTDSIFFVPPTHSILFSLVFSLLTLVFAVVLGLLASTGLASSNNRFVAILDPIFMLPLSTSAVTLGFGFIIALDKPPLNLRSSLLLIPIAHTLVALPFVIRSILPSLKSIPKSLREAASLLGASPRKVWYHVDFPIISKAIIIAAIFALTISLGEFGATVFIARPNAPTIPLAIYRFLGQPGSVNYGQAMAMSCILLAVTAVGFLFLENLRGDLQSEF